MKKKFLVVGIVPCILLVGILISCGINWILRDSRQISGIVQDADGAETFLNELSDQFGEHFSAKNGTFTVQSISDETLGERNFYCYSPMIDGIPVVGSQIILSVDQSGIVTDLISSYNDAIYEVDLSPVLSIEEVEEIVCQVFKDDQDMLFSESVIVEAFLVIYAPQSTIEPVLMYIVQVHGEDDDRKDDLTNEKSDNIGQVSNMLDMTYYIYANGQNAGEVYQVSDNLNCAEYSITYQDYTVNVTPVAGTDNQFQLADPDRGISIYKTFYVPSKELNGVQYYQAILPGQTTVFTAEDSILWGDYDYDFDHLDENAVALLSNLSQAYDYYRSVLGRVSYDGKGAQIVASYNYNFHNDKRVDVSRNDQWKNAAWYRGEQQFLFGMGEYEYALDVVAHEFTHAVINYTCGGGSGLSNVVESRTIEESISDIMGSLIERKSGSDLWIIGEDANGSTRSLSNPDIRHYSAFDSENDVHYNSGIYTYAAYRMMTDSRTENISDETWARVFYFSMFMLPSDATMLNGRQGVLEAATAYGFTGTQLQAVRDAFDAAGIIEPVCVKVTLTATDGSADLRRVSVNCIRQNTDGVVSDEDQIQIESVSNGEFILSGVDADASYELNLYYDDVLVKTVVLDDLANRENYVDNTIEETIDLSIAWLDIVITDQDGAFVSGVAVEVWAADNVNGIVGLIREAAAAVNGAGEQIYRLPVTPGVYCISFPGAEIEDTVEILSDMTLTYIMDYDLTMYGEIVKQYEAEYGKLEWYDTGHGVTYIGVFLLELLDFDGDGVEELLIGYSIPHPSGVEDCAWPYFDVWQLENAQPVLAYEGAVIGQSDVGKHCSFTLWNGTYYLITGREGYEWDITLLALEDGVFISHTTLTDREEQGCSINGMEVSSEVFYQTLDQIRMGEPYYYNAAYQSGCFNGSIYDSSNYTVDDLLEKLNAAKQLLGVDMKDDLSVYADTVQQYEDMYGLIDYNIYFQNQADQSGKTYMLKGVCLLKPIDFDGDSTSELLIGYGKTEDDETGFTRLYADVWGMNRETPVLLYSGASFPGESYYNAIAYKKMDGIYYLMDGISGERYAQTELYRLIDGQFEKVYTLRAEFPDNTSSYTLNGASISVAEYVEYLYENITKQNARFMNLDELEEYEAALTVVRARIGLK